MLNMPLFIHIRKRKAYVCALQVGSVPDQMAANDKYFLPSPLESSLNDRDAKEMGLNRQPL